MGGGFLSGGYGFERGEGGGGMGMGVGMGGLMGWFSFGFFWGGLGGKAEGICGYVFSPFAKTADLQASREE